MNWRIKGAIQQALSYAPAGRRVHYQLQRRFGGLKNVDVECLERIDEWSRLMQQLHAFDFDVRGRTLMELGTGYYPALPFCMYLAGAKRVFTVDRTQHLRGDLMLTAAELLEREADRIFNATRVARTTFDERLCNLVGRVRSGSDLTDATDGCVQYQAPSDARATGLAEASIDLSFSNNVLEHLPPKDIEACLREALRILKPGGMLAHQVDAGDHYADIDEQIDKYNFLQHSDWQWRLWNNEFLYQNRLRAKEYATLARTVGFDAVSIVAAPIRPEERDAVRNLRRSARFAKFSVDELCVTHFILLGRHRASANSKPLRRAAAH